MVGTEPNNYGPSEYRTCSVFEPPLYRTPDSMCVGIQMVKSLELADHSNTGPLDNWTQIYHLKTKLVQYFGVDFINCFYTLRRSFAPCAQHFEKLFTGAIVGHRTQKISPGRKSFYKINPRCASRWCHNIGLPGEKTLTS